MSDWAEYATEMRDAQNKVKALEGTLSPGELAEMDQVKAALYQALSESEGPEE